MMVIWVMPASYFCVYFPLIPHFTHLFKITTHIKIFPFKVQGVS